MYIYNGPYTITNNLFYNNAAGWGIQVSPGTHDTTIQNNLVACTINQQGVTVLLVEQNALMALSIADRGYVMESGRIVLSGRGQDLLDDENVQRAYLG